MRRRRSAERLARSLPVIEFGELCRILLDETLAPVRSLSDNNDMGSDANIRLPDDVFTQAQRIAEAEGKTADDIATEAVERDIARRLIANLKRNSGPSGTTEEQEIEVSTAAVHDYRRGQ